MKLSKIIILPAYNEDSNIGEMMEILKSDFPDFRVLIIDDSPNDLTKNMYTKNEYENSQLIQRKKKLGRGSAVRHGFEYAVKNGYSTIVEMDVDLQHDPKELRILLEKFEKTNSDLVIGSRYLNESKIIEWGMRRIIFSRFANLFAKSLFRFPIKDYTNGYRVYSGRLIKKIIEFDQMNFDFLYLTETLIITFRNKFICSEVPITFVNRTRGQSSVNIKGILKSFFGILKLKINEKKFYDSSPTSI